MKIEVFDKVTRERLGMISAYSFVQVIDKFSSVGSFSIKIQYDSDILEMLRDGNYVIFNNRHTGIIKYIYHSKSQSYIIEVKGPLLKKLLDYRVFELSNKFSGTLSSVCNDIVQSRFMNSEDIKRFIPYISIKDNENSGPEISKSTLGLSALVAIEEICKPHEWGFDLTSKLVAYNESIDKATNIESFEFEVKKPTDRTVDNEEGNSPVVFSIELSNLRDLLYEEDNSVYCSMAYVAGQGEGEERVRVEVGDTESEGIDRIEMYVDARDLQSINSDGSEVPEDEYTALLTQRGIENLSERKRFVSFSGTIITGNNSYDYGVDFFNGDYVTVVDKELNIKVSTQITEITFSELGDGVYVDVTFGYEKATIQELIKRKGVV